MAVYCGVCAFHLSDATENYGSFDVRGERFEGWDRDRISDTCESCAKEIRAAIAKVANKIAKKNKMRVDDLREKRLVREAKARREQDDMRDFEREWKLRRAQKDKEDR